MSFMTRTKSIEASLADAESRHHSLKRTLGPWDLAIMGVAVAVGAGIFSVGAKAAANYAGPAISIGFVIAAITCGLAMMAYAEFASTVPVAGSAYTFTYATLGEFLAWIIGWDLILETLTAAAVIAKYWGIYLQEVFAIGGLDVPATFDVGPVSVTWGPFFIVAVFTTLLVLGTKLSARVSAVFTVLKVATVVFVIVVGAFYVRASNYTPFLPPTTPVAEADATVWHQSLVEFLAGAPQTTYGIFGLLAGASLVFFAFIGFDVVATSAEEVRNPQRNLPLGIFAGLGLVTVLYVATSVVLTGMVPYTDLAASDNPSLATAFTLVGADWAAQVISLSILLGLTTVIMVLLLGLTRVVFSMSRDGLFPRQWSLTSDRRKTPMRLQIAVGIVVAVLAGLTDVGVLEEMINIGTLSAFVLVSIAVPVLRRKYPNRQIAYRMPFSPVLPIVSALACFWLMLNLTTLTWVRFAVWLLIGVTIYLTYGRRHSRLATGEGSD
ncbi:APC family permease [Miniimonas sp. S16]|uniref:APC family permease n=1 Tax=Miniimonas sp. S16 TaxID=2171623 RepID=UPI000D529C00|nr:amino acid permease [Miniimonas sp. S16]